MWARERGEDERVKSKWEKEGGGGRGIVSVCVCVCVRERERERLVIGNRIAVVTKLILPHEGRCRT
jgi:hypothetical protein